MKPKVLSILSLAVLAGCGPQEEAPPETVVAVRVAKAETADIEFVVRAPAYVFAREQASVGARITAPIHKLLVRKGDNVTAGQVLAQTDNRDLLAQREEATAAVTDAEANLERVASGTLPTEVARARGQVASAEAALNQARQFHERRRRLFEQGAIPRRDLVLTETELAQAEANHEAASNALDLLENQSREKDILMAKSKVDQARARLALTQAQLDFCEIRSPFNGTITEQFLFPGDMAGPGAPLFTVMDLAVAVARAQVPAAEAQAARVGQACAFAMIDGGAGPFTGRVSVVNQAIDPARRTVEVWCEIPNPKRALRAGAFGEAMIVTGVTPRGVVVPTAAVQFAEGTDHGVVMLASDEGRAVRREVRTGQVLDGKVQIKDGVAAGESVIVQGAYGLPDGTTIRVEGETKP